MTRAVLVAIAACLAASPALAHPGHGAAGLAAGIAHPFGGVDHLLAMAAVGAWAATVGGARRWLWPACFMVAMAAGAGLGASHALPGMELLIALSLVALGVALAARWRPALALGGAAVAAFGLVHGWAHGAEAAGGAGIGYLAGMLAATALLHGAGLLLAQRIVALPALRIAGGAVAVLGLALAAGLA